MNIALKEASESEYWIELLGESGKIMNDGAVSLLEDCRELIILPTAIVKSTFKN
ncbi:four helix bundle protein [uncultured Duncaniella sp.]|uniref:four helix bundle protein n=1 Tax=uncultured Duncaniella sp. TaxID=2768039 RepID=UPI00352105F7